MKAKVYEILSGVYLLGKYLAITLMLLILFLLWGLSLLLLDGLVATFCYKRIINSKTKVGNILLYWKLAKWANKPSRAIQRAVAYLIKQGKALAPPVQSDLAGE